MAGRKPLHTKTRLAEWLRLERRTRSSFAAEIGVSINVISRICAGDTPRSSTARRIVEATKGAVTFSDLFQPQEPPHAPPQPF